MNYQIWEHITFKQYTNNYQNNINKTILFESQKEQLDRLLNSIYLNNLHEIFYNERKQGYNLVKINNRFARITGISIFKDGIRPEWEDKQNNDGCDIQLSFHKISIYNIIQMWSDIYWQLLGKDEYYYVNGIRILDKTSKKNNIMYKIEIWINNTDNQQAILNMIDNFKEQYQFNFAIKINKH